MKAKEGAGSDRGGQDKLFDSSDSDEDPVPEEEAPAPAAAQPPPGAALRQPPPAAPGIIPGARPVQDLFVPDEIPPLPSLPTGSTAAPPAASGDGQAHKPDTGAESSQQDDLRAALRAEYVARAAAEAKLEAIAAREKEQAQRMSEGLRQIEERVQAAEKRADTAESRVAVLEAELAAAAADKEASLAAQARAHQQQAAGVGGSSGGQQAEADLLLLRGVQLDASRQLGDLAEAVKAQMTQMQSGADALSALSVLLASSPAMHRS